MLSGRRWPVVFVLTLAACSGGPAPTNGEQVLRVVEAWWRDEERLAPGEEFTTAERACIVAASESVDLEAVEAAADGMFLERTPAFLAPYADECLTDEHLEQYFRADMVVSGVRPILAECRAAGTVGIVRDYGFAAVLDTDRPQQIADRFDALDAECPEG